MAIKSWLTLIAAILMFKAVSADEIITTVYNVIESKKTEKILVLSGSDGRVYKASRSEKNLKLLKSYQGKVVALKFEGSEIRNIEPVTPGQIPVADYDVNHFKYNDLRKVIPTDVGSYEKAKKIFDERMNEGDKKRSECFKRAHIWAYDLWSQLKITSQKVFIFYTERNSAYYTGDRKRWEFHVAPLVIINGSEYVLDGTFMEKPIPLKEWVAHFIMSPNITCPVINKYKEYDNDNAQWSRLCYIMKTPMHYFSPVDIAERDKGVRRNHWVLEELQDAREMFKGYETTYEALDTGKATIDH